MPELFTDRPDYLGAFGLLETDAGVLLVANRRLIDGARTLVWDLPGGGVEEGETLAEALRREMKEETGLLVSVGSLLFVAEGERIRHGARIGVWRSFFFEVKNESSVDGGAVGSSALIDTSGEPDIVDWRFEPRATLPGLLKAPYHRGFLTWLASGGDVRYAFDRWID
jgi:8-oxo-dGTP pyrophosphatase MutT (NUDIX family)